MDKEVKVLFSKNANEQYVELNEIVGEEISKGVKSSFHQSLIRGIDRVKDLLRKDPFVGNQVRKNLIPREYLRKYGADNLWRVELPGRWRLLYSIIGGEIQITNFVLDIVNHKKYDKLLGYK